MSYNLKATGPYAAPICQFISRAFPRPDRLSAGEIVDLIEAEFLGTKQQRYGPQPKPEARVKIRSTIQHYVNQHQPIPIVVPWGSEKPDGSSIDIAELITFQGLHDLSARIGRHYSPAAQINVRVEDASAPHLFEDRADQAWAEAQRYTADLKAMADILDVDVTIKPESEKVTPDEFASTANARLKDFELALITGRGDSLVPWGWVGGLNSVMVEHYMDQYAKMYPGKSWEQRTMTLARYLAGASARSALRLRGDEPEWNGNYLEVALTPPIPGTEGQFGKRVHYRTFPLAYTSNHIAPWRAKGYLEITDTDDITPKLTTFGSGIPLERSTVELVDNTATWVHRVTLQADYRLLSEE